MDKSIPLRDALPVQAMEPQASPPEASIPDAQERDAIVFWLKAQAARCLANKREHRDVLTKLEWKGLTGNEMAYRFAAMAIKRGDHLTDSL